MSLLLSVSSKRAIIGSKSAEKAGWIAWDLQKNGIVPSLAFTTPQVLRSVYGLGFDLVVIEEDLGPDDLVVALRQATGPQTPILTLADSDRRASVSITPGADLTLDATTEIEEIARRGANLVLASERVSLPTSLNWGPLSLDVKRRVARWNGTPLLLTSMEFRIMEVLILATGGLVTNSDLSRRVWGDDGFSDAERISAHIRRIRRKLEAISSRSNYLLTVRGEGYRLADCEILDPEVGSDH